MADRIPLKKELHQSNHIMLQNRTRAHLAEQWTGKAKVTDSRLRSAVSYNLFWDHLFWDFAF